MKSNPRDIFSWIFFAGLLVITALPLLNLPPWFSPPDWGKTMVFQPVFLVLLFLFLAKILLDKNNSFLSHVLAKISPMANAVALPFFLLIALLGIFLLATLFSLDPTFSFWGDPYRAGGFLNFALYIILAIFSFLVLRSSQWEILWNYIFLISIPISLIAIFQQFAIFSSIFVPRQEQIPSTLGGPWALGMYLILVSFLVLAFGIGAKQLFKKLLYLAIFAFFTYTIFLTVSQAAYLGFGAGLLYFFFFYPQKLKVLKILAGLGIIAVLLIIFFLNTHPDTPLSKNPIVSNVLHWQVDQSRLSAWKVSLQALQERPLLGYGPENFSIGFDKYYDPALPGIERIPSSGAITTWWDRAHNILLDVGMQAGILAILIYGALLGSLLWGLQKCKRYYAAEPSIKNAGTQKNIICHGVQAAFLGYFTANLFSFDGFSTYLVFFLMVGYSLFLIQESNLPLPPVRSGLPKGDILAPASQGRKQSSLLTPPAPPQPTAPNTFGTIVPNVLSRIKTRYKITLAVLVFGILAWFIWNYNIQPFQVNAQINIAGHLAKNKECNRAIKLLEQQLDKSRTFLDSYLRLSYVDYLQKCASINEESKIEFAQIGYELLKENIELRPSYTRNWIFLGGFTTMLISATQNGTLALPPERIEALKQEAEQYFQTALQLSPKHQEVYIEWIKYDLTIGQYLAAKEKSQECIALQATLGHCWWLLARAQLSLGNEEQGNKAISQAVFRNYPNTTTEALLNLANAYIASQNYRELAKTYEQLIEHRRWPEYYAGLALSYSKIGEFKKARQAALQVLELQPEAKEEVEAFLQSLP